MTTLAGFCRHLELEGFPPALGRAKVALGLEVALGLLGVLTVNELVGIAHLDRLSIHFDVGDVDRILSAFPLVAGKTVVAEGLALVVLLRRHRWMIVYMIVFDKTKVL